MSGIQEVPMLEDAQVASLSTGIEKESYEKKIKLCECGCGKQTKIITQTQKGTYRIKGEFNRFILGHCNGGKSGSLNPNWKGGIYVDFYGYTLVYCSSNARSDSKGYVFESILIAEKVLGKPLPGKSLVHHADTNKSNNQNSNLVICQDDSYHKLLHLRLKSFKATGIVNYRKCPYCKKYDDPTNMYCYSYNYRHPKCHAIYEKNRKRLKKEKALHERKNKD